MKEEAKERLAKNIESAYAREQFPRDVLFKCIFSGNATYACAKATGWDTCAIGGFNPQALTDEFNVSSRYVPIMLITIGESTLKGHPAPRMSVEQVSEWANNKNEGNYVAFVFIPCHTFVILLQIIRHLYLWKSIFYSLLINKRDVSCRILLRC